MHIPIQVDYGVRALVDLAEHAGEGPVHTSDIARRKGIPEPYLARLLNILSKHGLVRSFRGPQGGHVLAMDPSEISMGMVMTYLGGSQTPVSCLDEFGVCGQFSSCAQREIWKVVEDAVRAILDATSIANLVERIRASQEAAGELQQSA